MPQNRNDIKDLSHASRRTAEEKWFSFLWRKRALSSRFRAKKNARLRSRLAGVFSPIFSKHLAMWRNRGTQKRKRMFFATAVKVEEVVGQAPSAVLLDLAGSPSCWIDRRGRRSHTVMLDLTGALLTFRIPSLNAYHILYETHDHQVSRIGGNTKIFPCQTTNRRVG